MNNFDLVKLQHFFEVDNRIKKEMYNNVPPSDNGYLDKESISRYTDSLYDSLIYIFSEIKCIVSDLFGTKTDAFKRVITLEKQTMHNFYKCGFDIDKLRLFYKENISNMNPKYLNVIKNTCVGYSVDNGGEILNMATTINEVLHFLHSYIMNNENILQAVPLVAENNERGDTISLRGNVTPLFKSVFDNFPSNLDVGWTDIVAINERKLLMMVRDRGHALTIEVTINNDKAKIEYFIPKICNIDMVNALPGVHKVNQTSIGTTGLFEVDVNNLLSTLYNFISKVPTDSDMIINERTR